MAATSPMSSSTTPAVPDIKFRQLSATSRRHSSLAAAGPAPPHHFAPDVVDLLKLSGGPNRRAPSAACRCSRMKRWRRARPAWATSTRRGGGAAAAIRISSCGTTSSGVGQKRDAFEPLRGAGRSRGRASDGVRSSSSDLHRAHRARLKKRSLLPDRRGVSSAPAPGRHHLLGTCGPAHDRAPVNVDLYPFGRNGDARQPSRRGRPVELAAYAGSGDTGRGGGQRRRRGRRAARTRSDLPGFAAGNHVADLIAWRTGDGPTAHVADFNIGLLE